MAVYDPSVRMSSSMRAPKVRKSSFFEDTQPQRCDADTREEERVRPWSGRAATIRPIRSESRPGSPAQITLGDIDHPEECPLWLRLRLCLEVAQRGL